MLEIPEESREPIAQVMLYWQEMACILLNCYRSDDEEQYAQWKSALLSLSVKEITADTRSWIAYQDVLSALEAFDPIKARELLNEWDIKGGDLFGQQEKGYSGQSLVMRHSRSLY